MQTANSSTLETWRCTRVALYKFHSSKTRASHRVIWLSASKCTQVWFFTLNQSFIAKNGLRLNSHEKNQDIEYLVNFTFCNIEFGCNRLTLNEHHSVHFFRTADVREWIDRYASSRHTCNHRVVQLTKRMHVFIVCNRQAGNMAAIPAGSLSFFHFFVDCGIFCTAVSFVRLDNQPTDEDYSIGEASGIRKECAPRECFSVI